MDFVRRLAILWVGCAVWLVGGTAQAERIATIVRGSGAGSDKAAAFVSHFVRKSYQDGEVYEVIDMVESLGTCIPEGRFPCHYRSRVEIRV